jgi:hypothetical protein
MSEVTKTSHMSMNIEGMLRIYKRRKINFFEDDKGRPLSDKEAREHIAGLQAKGHKLMQMSDECEGFDPFGKGCPGHPTNKQ